MPTKTTKTSREFHRFRQEKYPNKYKGRLDPELWQAIIRRDRDKEQRQKPRISYEFGGETWLDVLVKLKDRGRKMPPLLSSCMTVKSPDPVSRQAIVTGAVRASDIEALHQDVNVLSLKASRLVNPVGETFSEQSHAAIKKDLAGRFPAEIDGSGVIVGVVDFGCDFAHPNFCDSDGKTRLLYLWDQAGQSQNSSPSPKSFPYGREFDQQRLQKALAANDPYADLGYEVSADSHGTPVLDIAAGNGRGTGLPGMARNAHLIFVDLGDPKGDSPLNDRRLLDAVGYIFEKADEMDLPAVVNLSLGLYAGPHDGTSLLETGLDWLLSKPRRSIVVAAGNAGNQGIHFEGSVAPQATVDIAWEVFPNGHEDDESEIWYGGTQELLVTLVPTEGVKAKTQPVGLGEKFALMSAETLVGHIIHEKGDPNNGDNQIKIRIPPHGKQGDVWTIRLENPSDESVSFHAWIERDDRGQSGFRGSNPKSTLGSLSCGRRTMVVGAQGLQNGIAAFSGAGPTRDDRVKPEVSALGVGVLGAQARASSARVLMRGTSAAAPLVAGLIALLFQVAPSLSATQIYTALTERNKTLRFTPDLTDSQAAPVGIDVVKALQRFLPAPVSQPSPVPAAAARTNGGNGQRAIEEPWQAQIMEHLFTEAAAGKVRITFEVDAPNPQ